MEPLSGHIVIKKMRLEEKFYADKLCIRTQNIWTQKICKRMQSFSGEPNFYERMQKHWNVVFLHISFFLSAKYHNYAALWDYVFFAQFKAVLYVSFALHQKFSSEMGKFKGSVIW